MADDNTVNDFEASASLGRASYGRSLDFEELVFLDAPPSSDGDGVSLKGSPIVNLKMGPRKYPDRHRLHLESSLSSWSSGDDVAGSFERESGDDAYSWTLGQNYATPADFYDAFAADINGKSLNLNATVQDSGGQHNNEWLLLESETPESYRAFLTDGAINVGLEGDENDGYSQTFSVWVYSTRASAPQGWHMHQCGRFAGVGRRGVDAVLRVAHCERFAVVRENANAPAFGWSGIQAVSGA